MSDTTPKTRTITLTDRPPVKIREDEWPCIAMGDASTDDSDGRGNQANREWTREIRVRQHADGRAIVYGLYDHHSAWQGERGTTARRGAVLGVGTTVDQIVVAIRAVAEDLHATDGDAADAWLVCAQTCIADLPAEDLR